MERYFSKPALVRAFYFKDADEFTCLHTHDLDLSVQRQDVIYLYRDPVDTIYSQMKYHKEDLNDRDRIIYWAQLYGKHLFKWLIEECVSKHKTIIRYEGLKRSIVDEFSKVCSHFGEECDGDRLLEVADSITKERVKEKTTHDPQVVSLASDYEAERAWFRSEYGNLVWDNVLEGREQLKEQFGE